MKLFPSLLSANFACLRDSLAPLIEAGFNNYHLDIMDGNFVPNISYGPPVVRSLRNFYRDINLDAHLMVKNPKVLLDPLLELDLQWLSVHAEVKPDLEEIAVRCHKHGTDLGVVFNPGTRLEPYEHYLELVDFVLLMAVQPGFGGQEFKPEVLEKAETLRQDFQGPIQMDGGVGTENVKQVLEAGVEWLVAGSAIFGAPDPVTAASELQNFAG